MSHHTSHIPRNGNLSDDIFLLFNTFIFKPHTTYNINTEVHNDTILIFFLKKETPHFVIQCVSYILTRYLINIQNNYVYYCKEFVSIRHALSYKNYNVIIRMLFVHLCKYLNKVYHECVPVWCHCMIKRNVCVSLRFFFLNFI